MPELHGYKHEVDSSELCVFTLRQELSFYQVDPPPTSSLPDQMCYKAYKVLSSRAIQMT